MFSQETRTVLSTLEIRANDAMTVCQLCKHFGKLKVGYDVSGHGVGECAILAKDFWYPVRERCAVYSCSGCCLWEAK